MAVPTTGNFDMFGTGSITSIQGAMKDTGDTVDGLTQFNQLISSSTYYKFDYDYAGEVTDPNTQIEQSLQFRGYPVDPGTCRAVWVNDTVNTSRYGLRYRLPSHQQKDTLFGSLFGTPFIYGGDSGTVFNICSLISPSTWDSVTNTIVDLGGDVVDFADGGSCYINTDCEWIPPTPTPTGTGTPTPTPTNTPTPTPSNTPIYYYQLAHCTDGPSNSIYVYSVGTQITNGDAFTYFSNCYEYYDVDPGKTGTIDLGGLISCVCPTPTATPTNTPTPTVTPTNTPTPTPSNTPVYYYQLASCADGPGNSIYVYSVGTQITNGDAFSYFGNCYEYYDVDPGKTGTIDIGGLVSCVCPTPTPTPTVTPTSTFIPAPSPTPTQTPPDPYNYYTFRGCPGSFYENQDMRVRTLGTVVDANGNPSTSDSISWNGQSFYAYATIDYTTWLVDADLASITYSGTITPGGCPVPTPTPTNTPIPATPTPTPTPACPTYILGDANTTGQDACNDFYAGGTLRHLNGDFLSATVIYANSSCTGTAPIGYYSDGTFWRYWNGSSFTTSDLCIIY